jgi:RNA polymerase sigma-70 factor (ECF subfamily)
MHASLAARVRGREQVTEEAWLAAARAGEPWAFEQFYAAHQCSVFGLCRRMLTRQEDAQDAMQATFVRAFRELPRFRGDCCFRTWVYRIAVNECLSALRRRRPTEPLDGEGDIAQDGAPAVLERLAVRAALDRTRPVHRAILVLRFWEGLSYEQIAVVLNISLPAAKMRLKRARDEFRKCYEQP